MHPSNRHERDSAEGQRLSGEKSTGTIDGCDDDDGDEGMDRL
jgi:hypothetical protein